MSNHTLESGGDVSSKILGSIKTNPFLALILVVLVIEIIAYNLSDVGKWIYLNGYGPMSLQDARDIAMAQLRFSRETGVFEALGGQACGAGANGLMLLVTVPTAICLLFRWRILSIFGLIAVGVANLWQLIEFFSDIKKISGMFSLLVLLSICTLCLIILLFIRVLKYKKAPKATVITTAFALIVSMSSLMSCSDGQNIDNNYIYYPVEYQGHKAYMSPDGTISAMAEKNVFGDEAFRYSSGDFLKADGNQMRVGMKDGTVLHNFWHGGQVVLKPRKGEKEVEFLFSTKDDTKMGDLSDERVPLAIWDRENGNHRLQIMDADGNIVAEISDIDGDELASSSRIYHDGLLRVKTMNYKTAYLDVNGNVAIPPRDYFKADDFYNGHALVAADLDKWCVIDTKGETIHQFDEDVKASHTRTPGGIFILKDGTMFYDDLKGNQYEQPESRDFVSSRNSYYVYKHRDGYGISNYKGEVLLAPIDVDKMLPANENSVVVRRNNGKTELLSLSGESIKDLGQSDGIYLIPPIYSHTTNFGFWLERGNDLYYYTQEGEQPLPEPVKPLINDYKYYQEDLVIRKARF